MSARWEAGRCSRRTVCLVVGFLLVCCNISAQEQDPCAGAQQRALVFSGGGTKGAFETGAAYHLIVHRNCDFHEFAGASVGALNSAFLAQAAESDDASQSHANLVGQVESLVSLWQSVKGPRDIMRSRKLATLRFGLFGLENLNDFQPLRRLLQANISPEKLAQGRPTRAGVVSFWDGGYREVVARPASSSQLNPKFMEYLFASSVPPLYGRLPRIVDGSASDDPKQWPQFTDGGLRHITPVVSYFKTCKTEQLSGADNSENCNASGNFVAPPHEAVQQLFVVVSSPYSRQSDLMPVQDPKCCRPGTRQVTDGRKILGRTIMLTILLTAGTWISCSWRTICCAGVGRTTRMQWPFLRKTRRKQNVHGTRESSESNRTIVIRTIPRHRPFRMKSVW